MIEPKYEIELTIRLDNNTVGIINDIYISPISSEIVYEVRALDDSGVTVAYPLIREGDIPEQPKYPIGKRLDLEDGGEGVVNDYYISPSTEEIIYELNPTYELIREDDIPDQEGDAPLE